MTQEFVTLPREVVKQAIRSLERYCFDVVVTKEVHAALSAALEHTQYEQKPFAWISPRALEWGTRQSEKVVKLTCEAQPEYDFTEPLYTRQQPKHEPLTDNQIDKIAESMPGGLEGFLKGWGWRQFARAVLENDHNIK